MKKFMNLSIKKKLVLSTYLCIILMMIILTAAVFKLTDKHAKEELDNSRFIALNQLNISINGVLKSTEDLSNFYCSSNEIQKLYLSDQNDTFFTGRNNYSSLLLAITQSNVTSIVFYDLEGNVVDNLSVDGSSGPINQLTLDADRPFTHIVNGDYSSAWEYIEKDSNYYMQYDYTSKICYWKIIYSNYDYSPIGVIAICTNIKQLENCIIQNDVDTSENNVFVLDSNNGKTLKDCSLNLTPEASKTILDTTQSENKFTYHYENKPYYIYSMPIEETPFVTYIAFDTKNGSNKLGELFISIFIVIILLVILLFPLLMIISKIITEPLVSLNKSMKKFSEGDYSVKTSFNYDDEIGDLGKVFNKMVAENKKLINEKYVLTIKQNETEIAMLQAQINPHFLYNLINSLYWKAIKDGNKEIADVAYSMGGLFRLTLKRGKILIPLREEIELVDYYLKLQQFQNKNKLDYSINCPDEYLDFDIPKLIIQPLIENSIIHGLQDSIEKVEIVVSILINSDHLEIVVKDNAGGIPPDILSKLPNNLPKVPKSSGSNRFAIKNIYDRLNLIYDNNAAINIESELGFGTTVTILIPLEDTNDTITNS